MIRELEKWRAEAKKCEQAFSDRKAQEVAEEHKFLLALQFRKKEFLCMYKHKRSFFFQRAFTKRFENFFIGMEGLPK